jgi:hypothetical protein
MTLLVPDDATATNDPLPYVTLSQVFASAALLAVHVIPSRDVMTLLVPIPSWETATKVPFPYARKIPDTQVDAGAALLAVVENEEDVELLLNLFKYFSGINMLC